MNKFAAAAGASIRLHKSAPHRANDRGHDTGKLVPMPPESSSSSRSKPAQTVMVEFTQAEAEAVNHFLSGLGWGDVDAVREIVSARRRIATAIKIERAA